MACEQSLKKLPPGLPSRTKCRSQTELLFAREQPFERLAKLSTGRQQKLRSIFVGYVVDGRQTLQKVQLKCKPKTSSSRILEIYLSSFCDFRPSSRWCRFRKATQSETVADGLSRTRLPGLLSKLGVRLGNPNHVDRFTLSVGGLPSIRTPVSRMFNLTYPAIRRTFVLGGCYATWYSHCSTISKRGAP